MTFKNIILFFIVFPILLFLSLNPIMRYIEGISYDEAKILLRSVYINEAIKNKNVGKEIKDQLQLVPEIMAFGDDKGFPNTKAYTKYSILDREVLYYSLSASRKDSFENYQWNWPLIGKLPYKGFIQIDDAKKEEIELKKMGYDTYIGKSITMSTLGILPDPIITPMIDKKDPTALVYNIFHERTHQLFFKKNEVTFDENSAVLLGTLTSLDFFKKKFGTESVEYRTQKEKLNDIFIFSNYIDNFYQYLNILYSKNISSTEKLAKREALFQRHADLFKTNIKPKLNIFFKDFDEKEMNNSYILSYYRYYGKIHVYIQIYEKLGKDLNRTLAFFRAIANSQAKSEDIIEKFMSRTLPFIVDSI